MKAYTDNPQQEMFARGTDPNKLAKIADTVIDMATEGISTTLLRLKDSAGIYRINPEKIGIIGFSAGEP